MKDTQTILVSQRGALNFWVNVRRIVGGYRIFIGSMFGMISTELVDWNTF